MENLELGLSYNDVLIMPIPGNVNSRDDVDISVKLSDDLTIDFPLLASPMIGVVDGNFAHLLSDLGGMAIMHRFYPSREILFEDILNNIEFGDKFGVSVKVGEIFFEEYFDYHPSVILIDTANGHTKRLLDYCIALKLKTT